MNKANRLFCEARDAIDNESYKKARLWTLQRYQKILSVPQPCEVDPSCHGFVENRCRMLGKVRDEIELKKSKYWETASKIGIGVLIGIVSTVSGRLIYDKVFLGNLEPKKQQKQLLIPKQDQTTSNLQKLTIPAHGKTPQQQLQNK